MEGMEKDGAGWLTGISEVNLDIRSFLCHRAFPMFLCLASNWPILSERKLPKRKCLEKITINRFLSLPSPTLRPTSHNTIEVHKLFWLFSYLFFPRVPQQDAQACWQENYYSTERWSGWGTCTYDPTCYCICQVLFRRTCSQQIYQKVV